MLMDPIEQFYGTPISDIFLVKKYKEEKTGWHVEYFSIDGAFFKIGCTKTEADNLIEKTKHQEYRNPKCYR